MKDAASLAGMGPAEDDSMEERHNFSPDLRRFCLSLMEGGGGAALPIRSIAQYEGAPSERTLKLWRHDLHHPMEKQTNETNMGRPSKLPDDQLKIIGGFILFCTESHQGCTIGDVQQFAEIAFNTSLGESYISQHVHTLGFSSHRPASLKITFGGLKTATAAVNFLQEYQKVFAQVKERKRIVAIDQISFWDCGVMTSSYSLIGG